jgi:hypothetical protein
MDHPALTHFARCSLVAESGLDVKGALRARQAAGLLAAGDTSGRRPRSRRPPTSGVRPLLSSNLHTISRRRAQIRGGGRAPLRTSLRPSLKGAYGVTA